MNCATTSNIREVIKFYNLGDKTFETDFRKADYSIGLSIYILPSDMNLNIKLGTVGYNNKILVSDRGFSLGKNDMVNITLPEKTSPIILKHAHKASIVHVHKEVPSKHTSAITHEG